MRWCWLYLRLLGSRNGIRLSKGGIHLILCLALLRVFKTAISPANLVLYGWQVWAGTVSGCFVKALRWVQGTIRKKRKEMTPLVAMTQPAWLREGVTFFIWGPCGYYFYLEGLIVTCISKVQFTYRSLIRLTILGHYATFWYGIEAGIEAKVLGSSPQARKNLCFCARFTLRRITSKWTPSKIESLYHDKTVQV